MKRIYLIFSLCAILIFASGLVYSEVFISPVKSFRIQSAQDAAPAPNTAYNVIGWNDLGMHCISPTFKNMAILPPFNNLFVQVFKKGNPPRIITSGITVEYSIVNNKTVAGKTDFWTYVKSLFGVNITAGTGLTGNRLSGRMKPEGDHFEATGIPILPYTDDMKWNPYQTADVIVKDSAGTIIATTKVVIPVSDELNCQKCHGAGSTDLNILSLHDSLSGTNLMGQRPVLCAGCHSSNALGTAGDPSLPSLSAAMHGRHAALGASAPHCYDCHPGPKTKCNRSAISGMGPVNGDPNCESCHGTLQQVADSIEQGREPWVQEPTCAQCHGKTYSTGKELYRNSTGHGGVYCAACHNSPHAWYPSKNQIDNRQPMRLQGSPGPIKRCGICHETAPGGSNPHTARPHPVNWKEVHGDNVEKNGISRCQKCHGVNLKGGWGTSCYTCHGPKWL